MKFLNLFPIVVLGEVLKEISINELNLYKEFLLKQEYEYDPPNGYTSKSQNILNENIFKNLKNNILNLSKKYLIRLNHEFEDLQMATSWVNIINKNESIHMHKHSNSYISGVFYLDQGTNFVLQDPLLDNWYFHPTFSKYPRFEIKPEPGLVLLFPSFVPHYVEASKVNRISIGFNIIPKGEFGHNTQKLFL